MMTRSLAVAKVARCDFSESTNTTHPAGRPSHESRRTTSRGISRSAGFIAPRLAYNAAMTAETMPGLTEFIIESNRIEGITGTPTIEPSATFLTLDEPSLDDLCEFVRGEAGAELRTEANMNVIVCNHRPPPGGPEIAVELRKLIQLAIDNDATPFDIHRRYETLHPFMDGNGRSGRILWAWHMIEHNIPPGLSIGFLHAFYYQTLSAH